jgi:hypothetical protein
MLEARMGEMRAPPPSVNVRYFEQLAKKDWLKNLQTAYFAQRVALKHARAKSHFVRYFGSASRNTHVIEQVARMLLPSGVVEGFLAQLAEVRGRLVRLRRRVVGSSAPVLVGSRLIP